MPTVIDKIFRKLAGEKEDDRILNTPPGTVASQQQRLIDDPEKVDEMKKPKAARPRS